MKKLSFLFFVIILNKIHSQPLPPDAQTLYNECYNADVMMGQYVLNHNGQVLSTADGKSFYLKYIPAGATPSLTPMLVTLHGSGGRAQVEYFNWYQYCAAKGIGLIALQWYRGAASISPYNYFPDDTLYTYIDTALKRLKYPANKAMYHGFSRGSARSYAVAFKDVQPGGSNYFCTILSNAGKPDSLYPLYTAINSGTFGHTFYSGKKWAMYCGADDPDNGQSGCQGMNMAKNWVISNGGTVGIYIQGPSPQGHDGFHTVPAYIDSTLNYYLQCFNGTAGLKELKKKESITLYPNPTKDILNINSEEYLKENVTITNVLGIIIKNIKIEGYTSKINISDLANGIYFTAFNSQKTKIIKN
ncbi:MAG: T9SS type A sorting domain-containing protein [Bacteroidota bacterium]|nr:T9SS type A sorting domain-containing protein [Bacteroidota bacterium]